MRARTMGVFLTAGLAAGLLAIPAQAAIAASTILVSQSSGGVQGNDMSGRFSPPAISGDGQVTAFDSMADNLVPSDTNHNVDVFAHDAATGETERVSVSTAGVQANEDSQSPTVDQTGQHVAFDSSAANLVQNVDRNSVLDVFVRDRATDQTILVSVTPGGKAGNASSFDASISADGRYVAFLSDSSNLIPGDTNHVRDVFVRDLVAGTTERVTVASDGTPENSDAAYPSINADGSRVAFPLLRHQPRAQRRQRHVRRLRPGPGGRHHGHRQRGHRRHAGRPVQTLRGHQRERALSWRSPRTRRLSSATTATSAATCSSATSPRTRRSG